MNQFWKTFAAQEASSKVIRILNKDYTLPFRNRPTLTRSPIIKSGYVHPLRNRYLIQALHALIQKNTVEEVKTQTSLALVSPPGLVPYETHPVAPEKSLEDP